AQLKPADSSPPAAEPAPARPGRSARARPKAAFVTDSKFTPSTSASPTPETDPARAAPPRAATAASDSKLPGGRRVAARRRAALKIEPSGGSRTVLIASAGEEMSVVEEADHGRWLLVDLDGEKGWIESKQVKAAVEPAAEPAETTTVVAPVVPEAAVRG